MEELLRDKFGNYLKLTEQQWKHIIQQHPEMIPHRKRVAEVILNPEIVKRSKRDKVSCKVSVRLITHLNGYFYKSA